MNKIVTVFISDRGDRYLPDCIRSYRANMDCGLVTDSLVVNDGDHHLGMAGAVRSGWQWALDRGCTHVVHVEEDFLVSGPVDLAAMVAILDDHPELAQVSLKRQPWAPPEIAVGGFMECAPDAYTQRDGFVEHQVVFSLNPMVAPRRVLELGWPDDNEAGFTKRCLDAGFRFAVLGDRTDPPRVEHVGHIRSSGWRL